MSRGHPPVVAIAEAMHYAERIGFSVIEAHASWIPCDFMAISEGKITLVRVRRLWYARYGLPHIVASCTQEILELRSIPVAEHTGPELWARGLDRHWHRYADLQERMETVEMIGMSVSRHLGQQTLPVG